MNDDDRITDEDIENITPYIEKNKVRGTYYYILSRKKLVNGTVQRIWSRNLGNAKKVEQTLQELDNYRDKCAVQENEIQKLRDALVTHEKDTQRIRDLQTELDGYKEKCTTYEENVQQLQQKYELCGKQRDDARKKYTGCTFDLERCKNRTEYHTQKTAIAKYLKELQAQKRKEAAFIRAIEEAYKKNYIDLDTADIVLKYWR